MTSRHVVFVSSIAALTVVACGGGADFAPKAPESRVEREADPSTVEEAQARIERARVALGGVRSTPTSGTGDSVPATPAPPPPAPGSMDAGGKEPAKAEATRPTQKKPASSNQDMPEANHADDRCTSPCRALVSMRRAVAALCRMTGDADNRCVDAKRTLADSEGRVSPCSC
ncbi:MAG: hypothetical protein JST00_16715 [Deltaproteobacteria bacterium]|nr:hypothetical protein [Deltaproteobacteria bacterium]